jgi:predicted  nucleic acid-binding Zn-ribbon protein
MLTRQRSDLTKMIQAIDVNSVRRDEEASKNRVADLEELRKNLFRLQNMVTAEQSSKKDRQLEDRRITLAIQELKTTTEAALRQSGEISETHRALEENQRHESKRVADLQSELASIRKRAEDARDKATLHTDSIRNLENRISELVHTEGGRQEELAAILERQALAQVDQERAFKDWQEKYQQFQEKVASAENQMTAFDDAVRAAQRAQEAYDGLNQRLERRVAEVSEIQRLAEERIRQEWVAFKADEQKRWAGHALAQEETLRDLRKDVEKVEKRLVDLDDGAQTLEDQLEQTTETTEQQLQELMNLAQQWLSAYERIMGHARTKAREPAR